MTLKRKLLLAFITLSFIVIIVGHFQINENRDAIEKIQLLSNQAVPGILILNGIKSVYEESIENFANPALVNDGFAGYRQDSKEKIITNLMEARKKRKTLLAKYEAVGCDADQFVQKLNDHNQDFDLIAIELIDSKQSVEFSYIFIKKLDEIENVGKKIRQLVDQAIEQEQKRLNETKQGAVDQLNFAQVLNSMSTTAVFIVILALGLILQQSVASSVTKLQLMVRNLGKGEITTINNETGNDEFGLLSEAFNPMLRNIRKTMISKKYVERILKSMPNALIVVNLDAHIETLNQAAVQLLGYEDASELVGKSLAEIYPDKESPITEGENQTGHSVTSVREETFFCNKNGRRIPISMSFSILRSERGYPEGFLYIADDISERKTLEKKLIQSQKLEAVGKLAGGIAHDFNNLLTVIGGYSEITLKSFKGNEEIIECIKPIKDASDRAAGLIRQLMAFSRRQVLQPRCLSLNGLITDLTSIFNRLIGEDILLTTILRDTIGSIKADPSQMEQVIMNLVVNARDAMPGGGELILETMDATDSQKPKNEDNINGQVNDFMVLQVSDSGSGMDEITKSRIFEPFYTTKEEGKGTGLGLSTVYGIVKQNGGFIEVDSEIGKGTTFRIYLPRFHENPLKTETISYQFTKIDKSKTILIVEDESEVRDFIYKVLTNHKCKVLQATTGKEAIEISQDPKATIDLLLTDVIMPGGINGLQLAEMLQKTQPNLRTLFMSGYSDESVARRQVLDEDLNFIEKPFRPGALVRKVREVLNKNRIKDTSSTI